MDKALEQEITEQGFQVPLLKENNKKIDSPRRLFESLREELFLEKRECLGVIFLNNRNRPLGSEVVHIGSVNSCFSHPREIFRPAIATSALGVAIVHNHPSGEVQPSREDLETADILKASGEVLGIPLLDFMIVAKDGFYSFAREVWSDKGEVGQPHGRGIRKA